MSTPVDIDGHAVHVDGQGSDSVLMLHGWPDTRRLWDATVTALAPHYRCLRLSLPGHELGSPRQGHSVDEVVALLHQVVRQLSPDRPVTLLVHDWGCLFGYQFAMRHPECVHRLIGVDVGDSRCGAFLRGLTAKAKGMIAGYQWWLAVAWRLRHWFGGGLADRMTRSMARWLRCPTDPALIHAGMCYPYDMQWLGSYGGFKSVLPIKPHCPMLYLYGNRKPFMFHSQAWLDALSARPGSRVLGLRTGHWVMCQKPAEFNQAVLEWLAQTPV